MINIKTIAIFSAYYHPHLGGIERYIDNLMREFINLGNKVILVTTNYQNVESEIDYKGIHIIKLPVYNFWKNRYPFPKINKEEKQLMSKLDDYNIDAIIVNTRFHLTSHIGAKYGKEHDIPVYLIEHGSAYVTMNNKFLDFVANRYENYLTWRIKNKVTGWYGVSNACCEWLKELKIDADGVWYNSIDTKQKLPKKTKHEGINFLYAGRIIKQKGVENILISFINLSKKYDNIKLYIAGDGEELESYKEKYSQENIHYLGKLSYDELVKYYAKSDVFLYPSLHPEGLPTSILEAGLMDCAIIGTTCGGSKEVLKNDNSVIVETTQKSLERGMQELIDNPKKRDNIKKNMKKNIISNFSWENTAKKVLKDIGL